MDKILRKRQNYWAIFSYLKPSFFASSKAFLTCTACLPEGSPDLDNLVATLPTIPLCQDCKLSVSLAQEASAHNSSKSRFLIKFTASSWSTDKGALPEVVLGVSKIISSSTLNFLGKTKFLSKRKVHRFFPLTFLPFASSLAISPSSSQRFFTVSPTIGAI